LQGLHGLIRDAAGDSATASGGILDKMIGQKRNQGGFLAQWLQMKFYDVQPI
jgi:hypothetical protein